MLNIIAHLVKIYFEGEIDITLEKIIVFLTFAVLVGVIIYVYHIMKELFSYFFEEREDGDNEKHYF